MAGTNYWTEARQFFESETIIRSVSLVKLSGYTLNEIKEQMTPVLQKEKQNDASLANELVEKLDLSSIDMEPGNLTPGEAGGVGHFSGYIARTASKRLCCDSCKAALVVPHHELPRVPFEGGEEIPEMLTSMIKLQDRGGLLYPSNECIHLVIMGLEIFKAIIHPTSLRASLMAAHSAEAVYTSVYSEIVQHNPHMLRFTCDAGCSIVMTVVPEIARSLFRVFGKNVIAKANSDHRAEVNKKRKKTDERWNTRSRSDFKKLKLCSNKI